MPSAEKQQGQISNKSFVLAHEESDENQWLLWLCVARIAVHAVQSSAKLWNLW